MIFLLSIALLCVLTPVTFQATTLQTYTVAKIYDGDTLTLIDLMGNQERIRLICIDAPEVGQVPWGQKSLDQIRQLISVNEKITVKSTGRDQYNRILGEVFNKQSVNVNKKMVETGMAVLYMQSQKECVDYGQIEKEAKRIKAGVWSDPNFELPFLWRKTTTARPVTNFIGSVIG